jgi:TRAP-type uncharacterized transport system fused permease subunit
MTTYWFRPKRYGYGATPVTWQGWVVTLIAAAVIANAFAAPILTGGSPWAFADLVFGVVAVVALVIITRRKTEGGWRWRWGDRE